MLLISVMFNVEGAIEAEGRGQGGDDLGQQAVDGGHPGALIVEGAAADVVQGCIVVELSSRFRGSFG